MTITQSELRAAIEKASQGDDGLTAAEWGPIFGCCDITARKRIKMFIADPDYTVVPGRAPRATIDGTVKPHSVYKITKKRKK